MKYLNTFDLFLEEFQSYNFQIISDDPKMIKYSFVDVAGNKYLVEFKNIPIDRGGSLGTTYELVYFVEDGEYYSVSKIVNVNIYSVLQTIFGDILNDFIRRFRWVKTIFFVGLSKERERHFVSSRTRIYMRYLDRNPVPGFRVSQSGNNIKLIRT